MDASTCHGTELGDRQAGVGVGGRAVRVAGGRLLHLLLLALALDVGALGSLGAEDAGLGGGALLLAGLAGGAGAELAAAAVPAGAAGGGSGRVVLVLVEGAVAARVGEVDGAVAVVVIEVGAGGQRAAGRDLDLRPAAEVDGRGRGHTGCHDSHGEPKRDGE
jgi:hypothetical protein